MSPVSLARPSSPARTRREARRLPRALAAALLLGGAPLLAQDSFDVTFDDGLLSIRANNVSIMDLAEALADETGVSFVVTGDARTPVTTEIVDEPFANAVAKLSPNHLMMKDGKDKDAAVIEVVLMLDDAAGGSGGGNDGFLPTGAPADEVVGGDEQLTIEQQEVDQQGFDEQSYENQGFDEPGFDEPGFDEQGYAEPGFDEQTFDEMQQPELPDDSGYVDDSGYIDDGSLQEVPNDGLAPQ